MTFSRQIRPPIYSLKQSKLRRRRVIRYAILYFVMFVVFMALAIAPVVARSQLQGVVNTLNKIGILNSMGLVQPYGQNNNDTMNSTATGTAAGAAGTAVATATNLARVVKLF
jgi:1,3-beta-glucan synthase